MEAEEWDAWVDPTAGFASAPSGGHSRYCLQTRPHSLLGPSSSQMALARLWQ